MEAHEGFKKNSTELEINKSQTKIWSFYSALRRQLADDSWATITVYMAFHVTSLQQKKTHLQDHTMTINSVNNWWNFLGIVGGHLTMVRLPPLWGRHLMFLAGFLAEFLHFIRFLTRSKFHALRPSDRAVTRIQNAPSALPWAHSLFQ